MTFFDQDDNAALRLRYTGGGLVFAPRPVPSILGVDRVRPRDLEITIDPTTDRFGITFVERDAQGDCRDIRDCVSFSNIDLLDGSDLETISRIRMDVTTSQPRPMAVGRRYGLPNVCSLPFQFSERILYSRSRHFCVVGASRQARHRSSAWFASRTARRGDGSVPLHNTALEPARRSALLASRGQRANPEHQRAPARALHQTPQRLANAIFRVSARLAGDLGLDTRLTSSRPVLDRCRASPVQDLCRAQHRACPPSRAIEGFHPRYLIVLVPLMAATLGVFCGLSGAALRRRCALVRARWLSTAAFATLVSLSVLLAVSWLTWNSRSAWAF